MDVWVTCPGAHRGRSAKTAGGTWAWVTHRWPLGSHICDTNLDLRPLVPMPDSALSAPQQTRQGDRLFPGRVGGPDSESSSSCQVVPG